MLPAPLTPLDVLLAAVVFLALFFLGIAFTHPRRGGDWRLVLAIAGFLTPAVSFFIHDLDDERHWLIASISLFGLGGLFWIVVAQNREIRLHSINKWLRRRRSEVRRGDKEQVS